jgi:hypothetical protein
LAKSRSYPWTAAKLPVGSIRAPTWRLWFVGGCSDHDSIEPALVDHLAVVPIPQPAVDRRVDPVMNRMHRAVTEDEITPARMRAAKTQPQIQPVEKPFVRWLCGTDTVPDTSPSAIWRRDVGQRGHFCHAADIGTRTTI